MCTHGCSHPWCVCRIRYLMRFVRFLSDQTSVFVPGPLATMIAGPSEIGPVKNNDETRITEFAHNAGSDDVSLLRCTNIAIPTAIYVAAPSTNAVEYPALIAIPIARTEPKTDAAPLAAHIRGTS